MLALNSAASLSKMAGYGFASNPRDERPRSGMTASKKIDCPTG
jgi:hypothetical protein